MESGGACLSIAMRQSGSKSQPIASAYNSRRRRQERREGQVSSARMTKMFAFITPRSGQIRTQQPSHDCGANTGDSNICHAWFAEEKSHTSCSQRCENAADLN